MFVNLEPSKEAYKAAKKDFTFQFIMLLTLLACMLPVGYIIARCVDLCLDTLSVHLLSDGSMQSMCVCMYVCTVCMYVCMYVRIYVCMYVCMYCMYVRMYVCTVCMYVCM